jgi:hypothetical protein
MTYVLHTIRSPQPLECQTLHEAMARAGCPDPAGWLPHARLPNKIVAESMADQPAIEAPGVAHELIELMPAGACATRVWSDADPAIACAVWAVLPSPFLVSVAVAARLSAHYAVAGILDSATIGDTVAGAFAGELAGHTSDVDRIITTVVEAIVAAGIPTAPPRLVVVPDELQFILQPAGQGAPWRPPGPGATAPPEPLTGALQRLALQGRRAELSAWPPVPPRHRGKLPPARRRGRTDGQP